MSDVEHPRAARSAPPPRGLPGGVALPAVVFVSCAILFVVAWRNPDLIDLGPRLRPAGVGVLGAAFSFFWLLVAMGRRRR
jgi:hypothetical protein